MLKLYITLYFKKYYKKILSKDYLKNITEYYRKEKLLDLQTA